MARYAVHTAPKGSSAALLLDVQSDLLDIVETRVVVPLVLAETYAKPVKVLHPEFTIGDRR